MKRISSKVLVLCLGLGLGMAALDAAGPGYKVIGHIKLGGQGGWDYAYADGGAKRLYVSHTNVTEVVDLAAGKKIGEIADTQGVHGIAIADDLGRGFTSNGRANNVSIFDLKTLKTIAKVPTGMNPDSIIYEPVTHRVFTFNGRSNNSTAIDARTGKVVATFEVGGKPEFSQADGKGRIYANIESTSELIEIDAAKPAVTKRIKLEGCDSPSGLAIDTAKRRLYSVCENKVMTIADPDAGKVIATAPIGRGPDGVAFDNGYAFSSNGRDGTITVVGEKSGKYADLQTVPTMSGARTIAADRKTHKLYLPVAQYLPPAQGQKGRGRGRGQMVPGSFQIIVVGR
ncbi:MAG TPA: YncE family protein [Bryobacteraceae bacterium]|nr:YncE family protein [Bryobacteraceae bacterium]